jgi:hypothetical protein
MKHPDEQKGLMDCFCSNQYNNMKFKVKRIRFNNGEPYCDQWL